MSDEPSIVEIGPRPPNAFMSEPQVFEELDRALSPAFGSLAEFLNGRILFLVNDIERSTPTAKILGLVERYLRGKGAELRKMDADVIVASGSHDPPGEDALGKILGDLYEHFRPRVKLHRAREGRFENIGSSKMGTPVRFDAQILGYDRILTVNSVEPHYFAGYTGGRKSLMPGICHWETIEGNHRHSMDPGSRVLALRGNPVNEDMEDIAGMIVRHLEGKGCRLMALNCVNLGSELYALKAGDISAVLPPLVERANEAFTVEVKGRFDVVIAETSYPTNRNLYQSLKSFEHAKLALREGGVLILEARCNEGLGPDEFYQVMTSAKDPRQIIENVRRAYVLGAQKTTNALAFLEKNRMYIVSELKDEVVLNCFCRPFRTVGDALEEALKALGAKHPRVLRIRSANNVIPLVR